MFVGHKHSMLVLVSGPRRSGCTTLARGIQAALPPSLSSALVTIVDPDDAVDIAAVAAHDVVIVDLSGLHTYVDLRPWLAAARGPAVRVDIVLAAGCFARAPAAGFAHRIEVWRGQFTKRAVQEVVARAVT